MRHRGGAHGGAAALGPVQECARGAIAAGVAGLPGPPDVSPRGEPGAPFRRAWARCPRRPRRPTVYAPSMDSGAIGIFFFPSVPLMNAVLRAADAARAVGRQDLDARISREFTHRGRGPGRRPHGRGGARAASRIRSP